MNDELPVEEDYPDSAWNVERHDYGPREPTQEELFDEEEHDDDERPTNPKRHV